MIWPALFIANSLSDMWYCIAGTILLEWIILKFYLDTTWKKSLSMSIIGNLISALAGIFLLPYLLFIFDGLMSAITQTAFFGTKVDWILNFLILCFLSVYIETKVTGKVYKIPYKKLYLPMLTGNFVTYLLIAILMQLNIIKTF